MLSFVEARAKKSLTHDGRKMNERAHLPHRSGCGNRSRSAILVLAALVSAISAGSVRARSSESRDWIAFETIEQSALPIVRVGLNGSGPYHRVVLDVGFKEFILDATIVAGMGIELVGANEFETIDFYGREEKVPVGYLEELAVGDAQFRMVRTLLVEGEDGTGSGGLRSYGRIGRDVLEPLRLTVHYPRHLLYLEASPDEEVPEGGVEYRTEGRFLLVPVTLSREGYAKEASFVLDTSTPMSLLDHKWAVKHGFAGKKESQARIPELGLGAFRAEETPFFLGTMRELAYEGRPVGVLGADLLRTLSVTYDFSRDRLWLVAVDEVPAKETKEPF